MRRLFVWLHRYVGLALAAFLIVEGAPGALLAFNADLRGALEPRPVAATHAPGARRLWVASLCAPKRWSLPSTSPRASARMWERNNAEIVSV
jgi:uncharacterized iron-regulated membrane protein